MKKLTKNMKIILISVVSFICVAAIVVGCVFAFRDKNPNNPNNPNNPSNPNNPVNPPVVLTWSQKVDLLGKELNASLVNPSKEIDVVLGEPYEGFVGENETLQNITSTYFVVRNNVSSSQKIYLYSVNADGSFKVTDILAPVSEGGYKEENASASIFVSNESFVVVKNLYNTYDEKLVFINLNDINKTFSYFLDNIDNSSKDKMVGENLQFSTNRNYAYFWKVGEENKSVVLVDLLNKETAETEKFDLSVVKDLQITLTENCIYFVLDNKCYVYSIYSGNLVKNSFDLLENQEVESIVSITTDQFIVELKTAVKFSDAINTTFKDVDENYYNFSYKLCKIGETLSIQDYALSEGVSKLEFKNINNTSLVYSIKEMTVDSNNVLNQKSKMSYYYKDNTFLFDFEIEDVNEQIVNFNSSKLLTNYKLFEVKENTSNKTIVDFKNNVTRDEQNGGFVLEKGEYLLGSTESENGLFMVIFKNNEGKQVYGSMNFNGEVVAEVENMYTDSETNEQFDCTNMFTIENTYVAKSPSAFYKFNFNTFKFDKITRALIDNEFDNILNNNYDCVLINVSENNYTLNKIDGTLLLDGITEYEFEKISNDLTLLHLTCGNKTYIIKFSLGLDLIEKRTISPYSSYNSEVEITPYDTIKIYYKSGVSGVADQTDTDSTEACGFLWSEERVDFNLKTAAAFSKRTGYTLTGWTGCGYENASPGSQITFKQGGWWFDNGAGSFTFNAVWTINQYTLDLNPYVDGAHVYVDGVKIGFKVGGTDQGYIADYYQSVNYNTSWEVYGVDVIDFYYCSSGSPNSGNVGAGLCEVNVYFKRSYYVVNLNNNYSGLNEFGSNSTDNLVSPTYTTVYYSNATSTHKNIYGTCSNYALSNKFSTNNSIGSAVHKSYTYNFDGYWDTTASSG